MLNPHVVATKNARHLPRDLGKMVIQVAHHNQHSPETKKIQYSTEKWWARPQDSFVWMCLF